MEGGGDTVRDEEREKGKERERETEPQKENKIKTMERVRRFSKVLQNWVDGGRKKSESRRKNMFFVSMEMWHSG